MRKRSMSQEKYFVLQVSIRVERAASWINGNCIEDEQMRIRGHGFIVPKAATKCPLFFKNKCFMSNLSLKLLKN